MPNDSLLDSLLLRFEELQDRGTPVTPEELCRDCPECLPELKRRIIALASMDARLQVSSVADTSDPANSTHSNRVAWEPSSSNDKDVDEPVPARLGRYEVRRLIDSGGFGVVYLAYDDTLERQVAIKVPHRGRVSRAKDIEAYLVEARIVARLKHPHIVPVHDVGQLEDGRCFVVSEFIEGRNLASQLKQNRPSPTEAAQLVASIAEALHAAHIQKIVHRDVKPSNILIDVAGMPYLSDFGHALREEDFGDVRFQGLTPAYASPEQARGEGHLVDGRSNLFSLGVVLYELLTGERPFRGHDNRELLRRIASMTVPAQPPRKINAAVSIELERICLKAIAKRATDRYATAIELVDDLRCVSRPRFSLEVATKDSRGTGMIVPKGLRAFDEADADFFLKLLPGPRDRDGLPESIRFWKTRIEQTDPERTFRIGLINGPSGCGKSSLVKAGLLPRLDDDILAIYVESTADLTEHRIVTRLKRRCDGLPTDLSLTESLAWLRRETGIRPGRKVLIVLDQFEQWLHAHRDDADAELVEALRQCDGQHVQAIVKSSQRGECPGPLLSRTDIRSCPVN